MKLCVILFIFGITALIFDLFVLRKIYKEKEKKESEKNEKDYI